MSNPLAELGARAMIRALEILARFPQAARNRLGNWLGDALWLSARRRRHILLVNLHLCFPERDQAWRLATARACCRNFARAFLDHGVLATVDAEQFQRFVRIDAAGQATDFAGTALIVVAPHFLGLDAGGVRASMLARAVSIYARNRSAAWNSWLLAIRKRFSATVLIEREGFDLRAAVRAVKDGLPFYYLPDQDPGDRNGIFVPFFGIAAATLPMVPRLARLTGARVMLLVTEMTPDGYVVHLEGPWENYPSGDVAADTTRMNHEIERWVRRLPDQYLWMHRRFKTRPAGAADFYDRVKD